MKSYRGEYASAHPKFPAGSAAEAKYLEGPVVIDATDIAYSKEDDEAIDLYHRGIVGTSYHSVSFMVFCYSLLRFVDWDMCHEA